MKHAIMDTARIIIITNRPTPIVPTFASNKVTNMFRSTTNLLQLLTLFCSILIQQNNKGRNYTCKLPKDVKGYSNPPSLPRAMTEYTLATY
jgi:hypothetical protein